MSEFIILMDEWLGPALVIGLAIAAVISLYSENSGETYNNSRARGKWQVINVGIASTAGWVTYKYADLYVVGAAVFLAVVFPLRILRLKMQRK